MAEIKHISLRLIEHKVPENYGIEIELAAKIDMPMERKLGEEKIIPEFDILPESFNSKVDVDSMSNLFNQDSVNTKELIGNINSFSPFFITLLFLIAKSTFIDSCLIFYCFLSSKLLLFYETATTQISDYPLINS